MRTYRTIFVLALIGNMILAAVLVGLWMRYRAAMRAMPAVPAPANAGPPASTASTSATPPVSPDAT